MSDEQQKNAKLTPELGEKVNGQVWVRSTIKKRGGPDEKDDQTELLLVDHFAEGTHPTFVELEIGLTKQLRDYESVRVTAGIRVPCYKPEIKAAIAGMEDMLTKEVARITKKAMEAA